MMIEQLDDVTPEEIGEELTDSPFEPRYVMYMYEYKRDDGRVSYPLCFIYYNPAGCPVDLNMVYGQTTPGLTRLLKATKVRTGLPYCAGSSGSSTAEFAPTCVSGLQHPGPGGADGRVVGGGGPEGLGGQIVLLDVCAQHGSPQDCCAANQLDNAHGFHGCTQSARLCRWARTR